MMACLISCCDRGELDFRNENGGDRDQGSNSIDYSKRPQFEDRVSPAVDGGYCDIPSKIVLPILCAQAIRTEHGRNLARQNSTMV